MPRAASTMKETPLKDVTNSDKESSSSVFDGLHFAISGKFTLSKEAFKDLIERNGGKFSATVTQKVTHVITTEANIALEKRPAALATAFGRNLPMVSEEFLHKCLESKSLVKVQDFSLVSDSKKSLSEEEKLMAFEKTVRQKWSRMILKSAFQVRNSIKST